MRDTRKFLFITKNEKFAITKKIIRFTMAT